MNPTEQITTRLRQLRLELAKATDHLERAKGEPERRSIAQQIYLLQTEIERGDELLGKAR